MNIDLHIIAKTESTNVDVRRALEEGRPEGYAVMARTQSGGYGRRGNAWASPEGGLYLSLLLRPTRPLADWPTLSLLAAIAVLRAVGCPCAPACTLAARGSESIAAARESATCACELATCARESAAAPVTALDLRIKPPNDIIVGTDVAHPRKLVGILPETHAGGVALGFGVNLNRPPVPLEVEGKNTPVYLADLLDACTDGAFSAAPDKQLDAAAFAAVLLECFEACYSEWLQNGFEPFEAEYHAYAIRESERDV